MPQTTPTSIERPAVNARTRPSMAMVLARGRLLAASTTNVRIAQGRQQDAERPADGGKQQRLGDQLVCEVALTGAERQADRQLAAPRQAGREQQVGDIGAGNQQHQEHRPEQDLQRGADAADDDLVVGAHVDAVVLPELARDTWGPSARMSDGGALHGDARLEPRVDLEEMADGCGRIERALQRHEAFGARGARSPRASRRRPRRDPVEHDPPGRRSRGLAAEPRAVIMEL